jgi:glycosyltransferase involved in cell wall biosynthesis
LPTSVLPTIVSVDRFAPRTPPPAAGEGVPVLGWIGTHSTFPYLRTLFPVFRRLAEVHRFRLRVIGAGAGEVRVDGVEVESLPWKLEREIADLQSFDAAVYPLIVEEFSEGKSGFKAIQYLSCGIPYVVTPIGIVTQLGIPGATHLEAMTDDEWYHALSRLLSDAALRREMGARGREYAVARFSTRRTAEELARVFRAVTEKKKEKKKAAR